MSSRVFGRTWALGITSLLVAAAACGTKDDKKDPDQAYRPSDDEGGAGNSANNGGADSVAGKTAAGGLDGASGAEAGGEVDSPGGSGGNGTDSSAGQSSDAGSGTGGGSPSKPVPDDVGRLSNGKLVLQVTTMQSPAVPGDRLLYLITVGNTDTVAIKDVNVLLRVPKGLAFAAAQANPAAATCPYGSCTENAEATWSLGDLAAGTTQTIQFSPDVLKTVGDGDSIAAQVRVNATGLDPLTVTKTIPIVATTPAEVTLAADADSVVSGQTFELTVDVGQIGDAALFTGSLRLELPGALQLVTISDDGKQADGNVTWNIASLPVGSNFKRRVLVKVAAAAQAGDVLNPRASLTYEDATVASIAMNPITVADKAPPLVLQLTPTSEPVVPGGTAGYAFTVSNVSPRAVDGVTVYLRLPSELSFNGAVEAEPNAEICSYGQCSAPQLSRWTLGTLDAGTSQTITVSSPVLKAQAGDGTLVSTLLDLRAIKLTPQHLFKSVSVQSKPASQLSLGVASTPLTPGQTYDYTLDIGQIGAGSLNQPTLDLALPAGVVVKTVSGGGTASGGVVSWSLDAIGVGTSALRSVTVAVPADAQAGQMLLARAALRYDGGQEIDAISEHVAAVVPEALPLSVTLEASKNPIKLGQVVSYTTTIKNNAQRTIDGVTLMLRVPTGFSFAGVAGADPDATNCPYGSCVGGAEAVWNIGSMAAGATQIININPTAAATLVGGSVAAFPQRLTAVDLGGTIFLQSTVPTTK
jgi:uncharacterized repeat protein (TIGR01451 family)